MMIKVANDNQATALRAANDDIRQLKDEITALKAVIKRKE